MDLPFWKGFDVSGVLIRHEELRETKVYMVVVELVKIVEASTEEMTLSLSCILP